MIGSTISFEYVNHRQEQSSRKAVVLQIEFKATQFHPHPQWIMTAWDETKGELREFAMADMKYVEVMTRMDRIATMLHHSHHADGTLKRDDEYCCGCWDIELDSTGLVARCNECDETRDLVKWLGV